MFNPLVKILGVLALVFTTAVNAEEEDPFDITVYGSFLHTGTVPNALFFFNDIEQYDSFELRRAIRNHDIDIVVLASDGGSVWEGLNMAGIIHDKGIATYVPELPEKLGCYSACSFMFFGGKIRQADGILAVHQAGAYGSERDKASAKVSETQQNTQFTVSEIIGFLNEFETPSWVFEKMFRSREFYVFDDEEKTRLASKTEKISDKQLNKINLFIVNFFSYLESQRSIDTVNTEGIKTKNVEQKELGILTVPISMHGNTYHFFTSYRAKCGPIEFNDTVEFSSISDTIVKWTGLGVISELELQDDFYEGVQFRFITSNYIFKDMGFITDTSGFVIGIILRDINFFEVPLPSGCGYLSLIPEVRK